MLKLADTRPIGIGSVGAGASGMRGRDPDAPRKRTAPSTIPATPVTRTASASLSGS